MALFVLLNRGQSVICAALDFGGLRNYQYAFGHHFWQKTAKRPPLLWAFLANFIENHLALSHFVVFLPYENQGNETTEFAARKPRLAGAPL